MSKDIKRATGDKLAAAFDRQAGAAEAEGEVMGSRDRVGEAIAASKEEQRENDRVIAQQEAARALERKLKGRR
jgi:hypothetical protein